MEIKTPNYTWRKATDGTHFPAEFLMLPSNRIVTDNGAGGLTGWLYDGASGVQIAMWVSDGEAGYCEPHSHDYGEYCLVLRGEYRLVIEGEEVGTLKPGDELYMAPGVVHSGWYTADYRAIDGFECKRFTREGE